MAEMMIAGLRGDLCKRGPSGTTAMAGVVSAEFDRGIIYRRSPAVGFLPSTNVRAGGRPYVYVYTRDFAEADKHQTNTAADEKLVLPFATSDGNKAVTVAKARACGTEGPYKMRAMDDETKDIDVWKMKFDVLEHAVGGDTENAIVIAAYP